MRDNRFYLFYLLLPIVILLSFLNNCSGSKAKPVQYKKADLKITSIDFISKEILNVLYVANADNKIFVVSNNLNIWRIDLTKKKEEQIIESGVGPNEIYKPRTLTIHNGYCWAPSWLNFDKVFRFNINDDKPKVDWLRLPPGISWMDTLYPLTKNKIICISAGWKDSLLNIVDLDKRIVEAKIGERTFIKAMNSFNVNETAIGFYKGCAYVSQTIEPKLQIFSIEPLKKVDTITLSPPFYEPVPDVYDINRNDNKAHGEWMAKWTSLRRIYIDNDWLLLMYVRGYSVNFYYELINLLDRNERYYLGPTKEFIYDFKFIDGKFTVMSYKENEEETHWKKGEISLK